MEWLHKQNEAKLKESISILEECRSKLTSESRTPLNVSCSGVLRGVLTRENDSVCVQGTAEIHGKHQQFHSDSERIMQLSTLNVGIERAIYELKVGDPAEALAFLQSTIKLMEVPPKEVRFPYKFNDLKHGVCCEVFICEQYNIVSNLHAYQDDSQQKFKATDTVSAKSVDPTLMDVSELLNGVCTTLKEVVR